MMLCGQTGARKCQLNQHGSPPGSAGGGSKSLTYQAVTLRSIAVACRAARAYGGNRIDG